MHDVLPNTPGANQHGPAHHQELVLVEYKEGHDKRRDERNITGEGGEGGKWDGSGSTMVLVRQGGSLSKLLDNVNWVLWITSPLKSAPQSKGLAPALFLKRGSH